MTVAELIEELQTLDPTLPVVVIDEGGDRDPMCIVATNYDVPANLHRPDKVLL